MVAFSTKFINSSNREERWEMKNDLTWLEIIRLILETIFQFFDWKVIFCQEFSQNPIALPWCLSEENHALIETPCLRVKKPAFYCWLYLTLSSAFISVPFGKASPTSAVKKKRDRAGILRKALTLTNINTFSFYYWQIPRSVIKNVSKSHTSCYN